MRQKSLFIFGSILFLFFIVFTGCPFIPDITYDTNNPYDNKIKELTESFAPGTSWTFMIYLDADNNLESAAIDDFNEMITGLNGLGNANINVIVLIDRIAGYDDSNFLGETSNWVDARLFQINQTGSYTKLTAEWLPDGTELNMGDPITLKNFINYCKTNFNSEHYALILWNHGGGARSKDFTTTSSSLIEKDICADDTSRDILFLDEVQQAISAYFNSANKLDIIGFDACLMGTTEVAYEFRDYANVMVGSMASEWGDGWDYTALFQGMSPGSNDDPKELGKLVVKTFHDSTTSETTQTLAAIDLTKLEDLKTSIDNFAIAIYKEDKKTDIQKLRDNSYHFYENDYDSISFPYFDLNDLAIQISQNSSYFSSNLVNSANQVIEYLSAAIIASYAGNSYGNYYGLGSDVKRGLSIFFSRGDLTYNSYSHYAYQWWYTSLDTNTEYASGFYYGKIDFANSDKDSEANHVVETWRELFEAWYDPTNKTPGSY